ncbi:MAG: zinc-finger domain-containing protein [Pseudomonadota bacterium]
MQEEAVSRVPNDRNEYEVDESDLPLHCPLPGTTLWNSHPKVYLEISSTGVAKCPYCGAVYRMTTLRRGSSDE